MSKLLLATLLLATAAMPAFAKQDWWYLAPSGTAITTDTFTICKKAHPGQSPAAQYQWWRDHDVYSAIDDDGDMVTVHARGNYLNFGYREWENYFFRTLESCENGAEINRQEQARIDKYR